MKKLNHKKWNELEVREGLNGSGKKIFVLQGWRQGASKKIVISESFETMAELESWVKYAL